MAKILMVNVPMHGHVNPTLVIAKSLVESGHEVTYLLTEEFRSKIESTGAKFEAYDINKNIFGIASNIKDIYDRAYELSKNCDCLIYEFKFMIGRDIGEKLNKPTVRLFSTFALNEEIFNEIFKSNNEFIAKISSKKIFRKLLTNILFSKLNLDIEDFWDEVLTDEVGLNITFTSKEFQIKYDEFDKEKWKFVGPLIGERIDKCAIPFDKFKDKKIIYISLGTLFNNSLSFFKKCVEAFKDSNVIVIMSIGKKVKKEDLGTIPDNFYVEEFVPQLEVLKRASIFITHGGMNSSNEAIYYAVPSIVVPQSVDQPLVAKRMDELNIGKVINKKEVTPEKLRRYTKEILSNNSYKDNMIKMSKNMKKAGGEKKAIKLIEEYIENYIF